MQNPESFAPPSTHYTNQKKLRAKRANGQLSCAECKRLKRKCDKKLPCTLCVQKGCGSICPTGTLSNRADKKLVLSATVALHEKIRMMGTRICQLEDALEMLQRIVSPEEPHPLLQGNFRSNLSPSEDVASVVQDDSATEELAKALGTLSVNEDGHVKYFGPSAGSETLLSATSEQHFPASKDHIFLNLSMSSPADLLDNPILQSDDPLKALVLSLPPKARAWSLFEAFLEHAWGSSMIVTRQEIVDELMTPAYNIKASLENGDYITSKDTISSHKMAVLFISLGLGALVDLTLPPFSDEAEQFYDLALVALSSRSLFSSPELATIQALNLCAIYHMQGGKRYTVDGIWMFLSVASKLAQSLGLHRDSSRWNLDAKVTDRRRMVFWAIFVFDTYVSLSVGRPPSFELAYVDCLFPADHEEEVDENGELQPGPFRWMYMFSKRVSSAVIASTLTATRPSYNTILVLDQKIRECSPPARSMVDPSDSSVDEHDTPFKHMTQNLPNLMHIGTLIYIHRGFFAQAMLSYPSDPLCSPYAPSFLACYRSACSIIRLNSIQFNKYSSLMVRWRYFWNSLFSGALIVGMICARIRNPGLTHQAFEELNIAVRIFEHGAQISLPARSGLVYLRKLINKATAVLSIDLNNPVVPRLSSLDSEHDPYFGIDELETYGGYTKVMQNKQDPQPPGAVPSSFVDDERSWNSVTPEYDPNLAFFQLPTAENITVPSFFSNDFPQKVRVQLSNTPSGSTSPNLHHVTSFSELLPPKSINETPYDLLPEGYPMVLNMPEFSEDTGFNDQWAAFMQSIFDESGGNDATST